MRTMWKGRAAITPYAKAVREQLANTRRSEKEQKKDRYLPKAEAKRQRRKSRNLQNS